MRRHLISLLTILVVFLLAAADARANLGEYQFKATTGSPISAAQTSIAFTNGTDDGYSAVLSIGFTLYFDGTPYTQFNVSSNGLITLGSTQISACWVNELGKLDGTCAANGAPYAYTPGAQIASFWDDLRTTFGDVRMSLAGAAPNRIRVIDFINTETSYTHSILSTWQVRLYEGSNKIEFFYSALNPQYLADGATIGLAVNGTNFVSVTPGAGGAATVSTATPNNSYNPSVTPIPPGTLYIFDPCSISGNGDLSRGINQRLNNGDTLLLTQGTPLYTSATFSPLSLGVMGPNPCTGDKGFTILVEGADYSTTATQGTISNGVPFLPPITFTPTAIGKRVGKITITDQDGNRLSYYLAARGLTRLVFTGDVAQGGTDDMRDGAILMENIHVRRGESRGFTPFRVTNNSSNSEAPPATVTFSIQGISGGQYSIGPSGASLRSGESVTPTITFSPTGIGPTTDILIVNAEGQILTFTLQAISDAIGGEIFVGSQRLGPDAQLFTNQYTCIATSAITLPVEVRNIGNLPFDLMELRVYATDSTYKQGQPAYPILRDEMGDPIPSSDYILTEMPPQPPFDDDRTTLPIAIPVGATRTLYLTFLSQIPGKRFARAYLYTNNEIITGISPEGEEVQGLLVFDLFGRGLGATLAGDAGGERPGHVVFPTTDIGATATSSMSITNPGQCDLRISMRNFQITGGDVEEFKIVSAPAPTDGDDLVIKPGASAGFTFSFSPRQRGSRRATLLLRTNDSTVSTPGVSERGVYYLDLYGRGDRGLYLEGYDFGQALMGGAEADQKRGVARLVNTSAMPLQIVSIALDGADKGEFMEDPAMPWPIPPQGLLPGDELLLGLRFAPVAGGTPGPRTAIIKLITADGQEVSGSLTGEAGTRTITVNPTVLNFLASVNRFQRRTVRITNTGTMPVRLTAPEVSSDPTIFQLGALDRLDLAPGQEEYLEITYVPITTGTSSTLLTIGGNMTGGPVKVRLNGASKAKEYDVDTPTATLPGDDEVIEDGVEVRGTDNLSTSGMENESAVAGMTLRQSVPNPAQHQVEIGYTLAAAGQVDLVLYDAQGRQVRILDAGVRGAGEQVVRVDVQDLASGTYFYRLTANGGTLSRTMRIAR